METDLDLEASPRSLPPVMLIYRSMLQSFVNAGTPGMTAWMQRGWRLLRELDPSDPVEEILAARLVAADARRAYLDHFALIQKTFRNIRGFQEMCNRADFAMAKLVRTLAEYRSPDRRQFISVKNANIAQKQIVKTMGGRKRRKNGNRLAADTLSREAEAARELSPDAGGSGLVAEAPADQPALEKEHGA
jgi:hypothetical protein